MTKTAEIGQLAGLVNLERYPIADLESAAGRAVIEQGRAQLARQGLCLFPEFVDAGALAAMIAEAQALERHVHHAETWITGVEEAAEQTIHEPTRNACGAVAYDLLAPGSAMRRLYELDQLVGLFRGLLGLDDFYRCADPVSSCMPMFYRDGDELGWHFDPNDGVVTLLLQKPQEGGVFEFVPGIGRKPADFHPYLKGRREGVVVPPSEPGTLALFRGERSLHRVSPVAGPVPRIMLTMSFHSTPGHVFSRANRYRYSGRDVEIAQA